ncbi:hypothetical protein B0J17DRAFT_623997 [Rhizoctonia solani]|nr:hypothetical protein B0J17DRAFT_623997 [Rhizoctonia solani]
MPSFAGFYVWLRTRSPSFSSVGPGTAEIRIEDVLRRKKIDKWFAVTTVPTPPSEPGEFNHALMVYRQCSDKREYIPPHADAKVDMNGPDILERKLRLKVSEWRTIWLDGKSTDPSYNAELLSPKPAEDMNHSERMENESKNERRTEIELLFQDQACVHVHTSNLTCVRGHSVVDWGGGGGHVCVMKFNRYTEWGAGKVQAGW